VIDGTGEFGLAALELQLSCAGLAMIAAALPAATRV
jgi:hypothetical protein